MSVIAGTTAVETVIEMRDVSVSSMRDPELIVIENVNWSVARGDFWVIGGLQGSGKSDFLMMAAGLMAPAGGCYRLFNGEMPIFEDDRLDQRLRLGFVFDSGQLFNHLTISENISLPLRYHRHLTKAEAEADTRRMLELSELAPWADTTPGALARNWQRRVGLARALMLRPEILLVDNPLGGLDLRHRAWWLRFLDELSIGHDWLERRPLTLAVTTSDFRLWNGQKRQFAVLRSKRFSVLGGWEHVESAQDELVQELLRTM